MNPVEKEFIKLLRVAVFGKNEKCELSSEDYLELYKLSSKHDMAHLAAIGLEKCALLPLDDVGAKFKKMQFLAVMRNKRIAAELAAICECFEDAKIDFLPLKGSAMKGLYPESWMRTSCDIDILVKPDDLDRAIKAVSEKLDYKYEETNDHDASLFAPSGVHFELHYKLIRSEYVDRSETPLVDIWSKLTLEEGSNHKYLMSDALFYYYHIAHIAKHYTCGGTGIRSILDSYLLAGSGIAESEECISLLKEGGLLEFEKNIIHLARVWFGDEESTELDEDMGAYILDSGTYGTQENAIALTKARRGSSFKYILSRIWVPYNEYKKDHPLWKCKALRYPFWQVGRWFKLLFGRGVLKRSLSEFNSASEISDENVKSLAAHISRVGLS